MNRNHIMILTLAYVMESKGYEIYGKRMLQRLAYFMAEIGLINYRFGFWFRGPVSRELYIDIDECLALGYLYYHLGEDGRVVGLRIARKIFSGGKPVVDEQAKPILEELVDILKDVSRDFELKTLELLATIHYIRNRDPLIEPDEKEDPKKIYRIIKQWRNDISESEVKKVFREVKTLEDHLDKMKIRLGIGHTLQAL